MQKRRGVEDEKRLCSSPGKLTRALDITGRHHEMDLCDDPRHCFAPRANEDVDLVASKRIGITRSADLPWRFTMRDSPFISAPVKSLPPASREKVACKRDPNSYTYSH